MKVNSIENNNLLIKLKDQSWVDRQRVAGSVAAKALTFLKRMVKEKSNLTTLELSKEAEKIILDNKCLPTFKGYKGFPEACCISVNNQLVHGIPNNYSLKDGDLVSFDLGATFEGVIADSAISCIYGDPLKKEHQMLIDSTYHSLRESIRKIKTGSRMGVIGYTIQKIGKNNNFSVVEKYGGHGICIDKNGNGIPHAQPFVSNKNSIDNGLRFQPGMTFAIEPLFAIGDNRTSVGNDGWTVSTENVNSHFEHTVFLHEDYVEVMTKREDEDNF